MTTALDYALDVAPKDVVQTIQWLLGGGFEVVECRGGRRESFENVFLRMSRNDSTVDVVHDRSQWFCDLKCPGWSGAKPLNVLMTAMRGDKPSPGRRTPDGGMHEQLPPNLLWSASLPSLLTWGEDADREDEVVDAETQWREAMRQWLYLQE